MPTPWFEFPTEWGVRSGRPQDGEFAAYAKPDIDAVPGDDAIRVLAAQAADTLALFAPLRDDDVRDRRYAPGKWTVKQVLGHLCDDERIFTYRALCIARNDPRALEGFDENRYMEFADFETLTLAQLISEYRTVRRSTIAFFQGLSADAWVRRGTVNGYSATVRGLAFHIAGHELRHTRALREKYGLIGR